MTVSEKIKKQIDRFPEGETFTYSKLKISKNEFMGAAKALQKLVAKGFLKRVSKGVFYKPEQSIFGELLPSDSELIKQYLFDGDRRVAYRTGGVIYNQMGLTTQVPGVVKICSNKKKSYPTGGRIKYKSTKSYVKITDNNYHLLQLLDAIKDFTTIQDLDKSTAVPFLKNMILKQTEKDRKSLVSCALAYPPRVRAFLGALIEMDGSINRRLKESLNPLSSYSYGISESILSTVSNWNIR